MQNDFYTDAYDGVVLPKPKTSNGFLNALGNFFSDPLGSLDGAVNTGFEVVGGIRDRVVEYSEGVTDALDFGDNFYNRDTGNYGSRNPEVNVTDFDRSNPTAFKSMMSGNNMLLIAGGLLALGVVVYAVRK